VVGGRRDASVALAPEKIPGTHRIGDWSGTQGKSGRVRIISPPNGILSPDRPARSESLYRLSYHLGIEGKIMQY